MALNNDTTSIFVAWRLVLSQFRLGLVDFGVRLLDFEQGCSKQAACDILPIICLSSEESRLDILGFSIQNL